MSGRIDMEKLSWSRLAHETDVGVAGRSGACKGCGFGSVHRYDWWSPSPMAANKATG